MTIALLIVKEGAIFIATLLFTLILFAPLFEWLLHKYVMHRRVKIGPFVFSYPYKAHNIIHHHTFMADETYHVRNEKDEHFIPMAWWNGIVLVAAGMMPFSAVCLCIGHWFGIMAGGFLGCTAYYAAYESMHWCMHKPLVRRRLVEKYGFFRKLNGHHILHHRYMGKNYNVVLPIYDWAFGTLMRRSPKPFRQVRGRAVPSVQPL